jgi:hypothetical protein
VSGFFNGRKQVARSVHCRLERPTFGRAALQKRSDQNQLNDGSSSELLVDRRVSVLVSNGAGGGMQQVSLFLFHLDGTDIFAFTSELSGECLPPINDGQPWTFLEEIKGLVVEEYVDPPEFHQAVSAVLTDGYFVFHGEMLRSRDPVLEAR